jgi:hypothetical protein
VSSSPPTAPAEPQPAAVSPVLRDVVTVLAYVTVFAGGLMLALIAAFHIPTRPDFLGAHWPLAVVVAVAGNLGLGLLAGWGLQGRAGPAVAFLGWIVGVGLVMFGGSDDVVIGGSPGDWVPLGFLVSGAVAGILAVAVSLRFTDPALRPRPTWGTDARSSLRASGRR